MKIGLQVESISEPPVGDYEVIDFNSLEKVHDASCEELFIGDCLDYTEQRKEALRLVLSKIRYGGKGIITGVDLLSVCRMRASFIISDNDCKSLIYSNKKSVSSVLDTVDELTSRGFLLESKSIESSRYCITFRRPVPNENSM